MLDVMGTKSLIGQRQDKRIFDLMESIRTIEKEYSTNDYVRMTFYSDSIILYTIDNCEKSYKSILYLTSTAKILCFSYRLSINHIRYDVRIFG